MKLPRTLYLFLVLMVSTAVIFAQSPTCPELAEQALHMVGNACVDLGRNEVCYGHYQATAYDEQATSIPDFSRTGDIIPLLDIHKLETSALDVDNQQWGVAVLSLQADLPDTLPGQNVTFLVYGQSELSADFSSIADADEIVSFHLSTGIGEPQCVEVPEDGILVQTPQETVVHFRINGVNIEMGSTGLLTMTDTRLLRVRTLEGSITMTTAGRSQQVAPGFEVQAGVNVAPSEPIPYDYNAVRHVPVGLLPYSVSIPINFPAHIEWFDSGIALTTGDMFSLTASGLVNPCFNCDDHPLVGPEGLVEEGTPNELDLSDDLMPPLPDVTVAALIGRIGDDGEPFYIGTDGQFTADNDGTLQFRINDEPVGNEQGTWHIIFERSA